MSYPGLEGNNQYQVLLIGFLHHAFCVSTITLVLLYVHDSRSAKALYPRL